MEGTFNFKSFGNDTPAGDGGYGRPPGNFPLARQSSVYSLTFDEFQNTVGGNGKDFGSMNMDELLKNIWNAEENQNVGSTSGVKEGSGYLQRQGSLTLPRTLSQKTVDQVWRDISKDYGMLMDGNAGVGGMNIPKAQREPTLGEVTLEEFLVRAGVVREEIQMAPKSNNVGFFGNLSGQTNNSGIGFVFPQQEAGAPAISLQSPNLQMDVNGARPSSQQQTFQSQKQQPLLPKQPTLAYGAQMGIPSSSQLGSPRSRGGILGISDQTMNNDMLQNVGLHGGGLGMVGLGGNGVTIAASSPVISSDGLTRSNGEMSSVSPVPYVFSGGLRGRKTAVLEKVVERRQRRMIKNRESAARSRARKQAYTMELEAEVASLKEENDELRKKQAEMLEMHKNQVLEMMNHQRTESKRLCLRRTQTGPW